MAAKKRKATDPFKGIRAEIVNIGRKRVIYLRKDTKRFVYEKYVT